MHVLHVPLLESVNGLPDRIHNGVPIIWEEYAEDRMEFVRAFVSLVTIFRTDFANNLSACSEFKRF